MDEAGTRHWSGTEGWPLLGDFCPWTNGAWGLGGSSWDCSPCFSTRHGQRTISSIKTLTDQGIPVTEAIYKSSSATRGPHGTSNLVRLLVTGLLSVLVSCAIGLMWVRSHPVPRMVRVDVGSLYEEQKKTLSARLKPGMTEEEEGDFQGGDRLRYAR